MNPNLADRTAGEALWLWRVAEGLTQARAAVLLRVGRTALSAAENAAQTRFKPPRGRTPPTRAILRLARRRSGLGLAGTAAAAGVSRVTVVAREKRADPAMVAFWEARGFWFPAPE